MTRLDSVLWITHSGQVSHCSKGTPPDSSLMSGSLLLILCPRAVSNSNHLTKEIIFFICGLIWTISFLLFPASASVDHGGRCNTFAPEPHCDESQPEVEGGRVGGIGCCTCLLPWGFWRSDYAGCGMEDLFSRGDAWQKKKKRKEEKRKACTWAGVSVANYMEGICFRQLWRLERGLSKVFLMFSYCYLTL